MKFCRIKRNSVPTCAVYLSVRPPLGGGTRQRAGSGVSQRGDGQTDRRTDEITPQSTHLILVFLLIQNFYFIRLLHQKDLPHMKLLSTLTEKFKNDSRTLDKLEEYLNCQCCLCGFLTKNKRAKEDHETFCLARHLTLSLYYAEPLNADLFSSKYIEERKRENVNEHLTGQLNSLSEELSSGNFSNSAKQHCRAENT